MPAAMDSLALLVSLHSNLLRSVSSDMNQHFQGLAVAARACHKQGRINKRAKRQLEHLDIAASWARHVTMPRCADFLREIEQQMADAVKPKAEESVDVEMLVVVAVAATGEDQVGESGPAEVAALENELTNLDTSQADLAMSKEGKAQAVEGNGLTKLGKSQVVQADEEADPVAVVMATAAVQLQQLLQPQPPTASLVRERQRVAAMSPRSQRRYLDLSPEPGDFAHPSRHLAPADPPVGQRRHQRGRRGR